MKARDARRNFIVMVALAFVAVFTSSAIIGIAAITPFVYSKACEILEKAKENHKNTMPAAKAAKAKRDALKKEKAKLEKDKKALEKKKLAARKEQAKKIYEYRQKNGYEESLPLVEKEAKKALESEAGVSDKGKKAKKEKVKKEKVKKEKPANVKPAKQNKPEPIILSADTASDASEADDTYTNNGSMFRGISF